MGQKIQLQDKDGTLQYPVTSTTLVVDPNGKTVEERLQEMWQGGATTLDDLLDVEVSDAQNGEFLMYEEGFWVPQRISTSSGSTIITVDSEMSSVSANPVQNKVVKQYVDDAEAEAKKYTDDAIADLSQNEITIDSAMSDTSENAVQNKVIKKYVDEKVANTGSGNGTSDIVVDAELSATSSNAIQNKAVTNAINNLNERIDGIESGAIGPVYVTDATLTFKDFYPASITDNKLIL